MDPLFEERGGIVISPALHILWQPDERRAAIGRIQHGGERIGQGPHNLRRVRDAIPIAADSLERIVHAKRRVVEVFHLLQHGIGQAGQEGIPAQHQHRQTVGMSEARRRQQVRRAGARRGRAQHKPLTQPLLCITRSGESHTGFVLPTIERQSLAHAIKCLAQTGDISVAENAKAATADAHFFSINFNELIVEVADNGLGRGEADGGVRHGCLIPKKCFAVQL